MDGIIIINKEKECTSHDVVRRIKKLLNEKVGHTGTLDPNATGVLPLLIGKGTKISKYLITHDKTYEATLKLGEKRSTADIEGDIIQTQEVPIQILEKNNVENALKQMIGKQKQIPPIYSAIKVNGKKLYEYARKGQGIQVEPRDIEIYNIQLKDIDKENVEITFRVHCSKGTYIRTLCENIAEKLQNIGYMKELKRTQVGEFKIEDSIKIEQLEEDNEIIEQYFISVEKYFERYLDIHLKDKQLQLFLNGVQLNFKLDDGIYKIYDQQEKFIGLGTIKNNLLKRDIVI
ncbi:MAG: tRNA pseudouridine(55) synthase TruB [Clostridia bacterium]|jgi:tRNA pseudouridine55 synthase|nr:tRNA pseudouridine(55) synthase TruB [Clostridia bacterium]